jgi:hypothetical protein
MLTKIFPEVSTSLIYSAKQTRENEKSFHNKALPIPITAVVAIRTQRRIVVTLSTL